jgi:hypothetical protein
VFHLGFAVRLTSEDGSLVPPRLECGGEGAKECREHWIYLLPPSAVSAVGRVITFCSGLQNLVRLLEPLLGHRLIVLSLGVLRDDTVQNERDDAANGVTYRNTNKSDRGGTSTSVACWA